MTDSVIDPETDPLGVAAQAARALAERTGIERHDLALVLGSGWRPAADVLGEPVAEVPLAELPGFLAPTVTGHGGTVRSVDVDGRKVLITLGRTHLYEGVPMSRVVHGVRTVAAAGVKTVILTNAAGCLMPDARIGQPVLISDHINMTARSPLVGAEFVDLTDLYSPRLRALAKEIDPSLVEGVYVGLPGPHFETPAEIRMLRGWGADLVGMSTVLEAIAARALGVEVFGLSMVTNLAAGMTGEPLDHLEVLEAGRRSATALGGFLRDLIARA
ncbi:purine-nucleoside phosphorylase [Actinokineospora sp. UTMC 2448]|uniref:purine-nucleoside phosphorylase n=1 Tax=Actinokineospora sp. UTMC 2448 TaxID=2268449 RepID=UPI0021645C03|nr:purine-nucleoside phosphorylase [Actinokineospora sp. UTMC 2448]UVS81898.1 Purine nucleoside phosphorylase [Actinokineospora sp. UTMC 2448]